MKEVHAKVDITTILFIIIQVLCCFASWYQNKVKKPSWTIQNLNMVHPCSLGTLYVRRISRTSQHWHLWCTPSSLCFENHGACLNVLPFSIEFPWFNQEAQFLHTRFQTSPLLVCIVDMEHRPENARLDVSVHTAKASPWQWSNRLVSRQWNWSIKNYVGHCSFRVLFEKYLDFGLLRICYGHIMKLGIPWNTWTFQALQEMTEILMFILHQVPGLV